MGDTAARRHSDARRSRSFAGSACRYGCRGASLGGSHPAPGAEACCSCAETEPRSGGNTGTCAQTGGFDKARDACCTEARFHRCGTSPCAQARRCACSET